MLERIKKLLGITDNTKDDLLSVLIESAREFAVNYTHNKEAADSLVIADLVVNRFNLLGTEGMNSENYSGVSFSYDSTIPDYIKKSLQSMRKVMTIND